MFKAGRYLVLGLGLLLPALACADVWVRMDEEGLGHFAAQQLDDRYALFYRGPAQKPAAEQGDVTPVAQTPSLKVFSPKLAHFFENSTRYRQIQPLIQEAARTHRIDYELLQALIAAESAFDTSAVSNKGAIGLMQIMPDTARRFGFDSDRWASIETKLLDPKTNIRIGTRYLRLLMDMFPGQLDLALASYNAGEGAVQKAGNAVPNFKETQNYVAMVMELYAVLKPPVLTATIPNKGTGRVRAQFVAPGGATGRGNMVAPLQAVHATDPSTPLAVD
jgi:hypothetical protein